MSGHFNPVATAPDYTTRWLIVGSIVAGLILIAAAWLDTRPTNEGFRPTIQPKSSWIPAPRNTERAFAMREVGKAKP